MRKRLLSGQKASAHGHGNARLFLHGLRNEAKTLVWRTDPWVPSPRAIVYFAIAPTHLTNLATILRFDNLTGRRILGLLVNLVFTGLLLINIFVDAYTPLPAAILTARGAPS
jgi:hypothetical protein